LSPIPLPILLLPSSAISVAALGNMQVTGSWALTPAQEVSRWPKLQGAILRAAPRGRVQCDEEEKNCVEFMDSFFPMSDPSVAEEIRTKLCLYFLSTHKSL